MVVITGSVLAQLVSVTCLLMCIITGNGMTWPNYPIWVLRYIFVNQICRLSGSRHEIVGIPDQKSYQGGQVCWASHGRWSGLKWIW